MADRLTDDALDAIERDHKDRCAACRLRPAIPCPRALELAEVRAVRAERDEKGWAMTGTPSTAARLREVTAERDALRERVALLEESLRPFAERHWRQVHPGRPMLEAGFFETRDVRRAQNAMATGALPESQEDTDG